MYFNFGSTIVMVFITIPLTKTTLLCPSGFLDGGNGSCYFFSHDLEPWTNAVMSCRILGAFLAEIETPEEFENIRALARNADPGSSVWVGLSDKREKNVWEWATSHSVYTRTSAFDMWAPGEPDHYSQDGTEDCVVLDQFHGDGKWHDFQLADVMCNRPTKYVCEYSLNCNGPCTGTSSGHPFVAPTKGVTATSKHSTLSSLLQFTSTQAVQTNENFKTFCQKIQAMHCNSDVNIVCGSDSHFYSNRCIFSKAMCSNPTLLEKDLEYCSLK